MESIGFSHSVRNCTMMMLERTFYGVELKNFEIRPKDGGLAGLTFSVTVTPDGNEIALLAEYLQEEIPVVVEPQPDLFGPQEKAKKVANLTAVAPRCPQLGAQGHPA